GPRANLRLVVLDGSVGAALDQAAAGLPGVVLDIAVVAVAAQVVHAPAYGRGGGRGPFGLQFGAAVAVDDLAVGHVVVLVAQRIIDFPVDERRAEVAGGFLPGMGVRQREVQGGRYVQPQRGRYRGVLRIAQAHAGIAVVAAGVHAIRPALVQRAAAAEGQALRIVRAHGRLHFVLDGAAAGLLGNDIDHAADGAFADQHRGRAAQNFNA